MTTPYDDIENLNIEKTKAETDVKCPSCGAAVSFDPGTGKLVCPYCGYTKEITFDNSVSIEEQDFLSAEKRGNVDWGVKKKKVICKSCAAVSVYDELQISDICPYCGSNQVMEEADNDTLAPNGVCTFEVTAEQAGNSFKNWIKGKLFTPKKAKQSANPEAFTGVYLPYWTFDSETDSFYTARYGINRQVKDREGNVRIVTDWYNTSGTYSSFFDDVLISGTNRYDPTLMHRIGPFDTSRGKPYKPEYVSGFVSERYTIGLEDGWKDARNEINAELRSAIHRRIVMQTHADQVSSLDIHTDFSNITYKYFLMPLWLSAFTYKDKIFRFMVNGQTGRVGGRAPVSPLRVFIACLIGAALIALFAYFMSSQGGM